MLAPIKKSFTLRWKKITLNFEHNLFSFFNTESTYEWILRNYYVHKIHNLDLEFKFMYSYKCARETMKHCSNKKLDISRYTRMYVHIYQQKYRSDWKEEKRFKSYIRDNTTCIGRYKYVHMFVLMLCKVWIKELLRYNRYKLTYCSTSIPTYRRPIIIINI